MIRVIVHNFTVWSTLINEGATTSTVDDKVVHIDANKFEFLEAFGHLGSDLNYQRLD